jgi:hypothetical protein
MSHHRPYSKSNISEDHSTFIAQEQIASGHSQKVEISIIQEHTEQIVIKAE